MNLTVTVSARHTIESDHSRVTITSDRINGGRFTATVRGSVIGSDTIRLTASAPGYETAEASFTVTVDRLPPPPPPPPIPTDLRFDLPFWRELVFNGYECPRAGSCPDYYADGRPSTAIEDRFVLVLPTTSPNFYIRTHDDDGFATFSRHQVSTMRRLIPRFVEALTGSRYSGLIEEGTQDFERHGWVTIMEATEPGAEWCGRAGVGWLAGRIEMNLNATRCSFADVVGHEIGHALGFWHVSGAGLDLMYPKDVGAPDFFSSREAFHAQVAYQLGRGHHYTDGRFTATREAQPDDHEPPDLPMIECPASLRH